jgi:predicted PurR-regulated permease PerM
MKRVLYWLLAAGVISGVSYLYQPTTELAVVSGLLLVLLAGVVTWSSHKLASGSKAILKTLVVSVVAGFMYSQAMDIAYSGFAAPAGLRLAMLPEALAAAFLLALIGSISSAVFLRPKKKEESNS